MKDTVALKEPSALASGVVQVMDAAVSALPGSSAPPTPERAEADEDFREMQRRRYTTPFPVVWPRHHGRLNE